MSSFGDEWMNVDATNESDAKRDLFSTLHLRKMPSLSLFD